MSATNSAGGVVGGATASTTGPDIAGALNKIANSALMRKQTELAEQDLQAKLDNAKANLKNADAQEVNSQARMIEAHTDQLRTNSAIELNTANIGYLGAMTNYTKQKQENETAMNKMQIKEIDQRIVNSIQELAAKVVYLQKTGDAALMSASAAQRHAAAQELMAQVAQQNGISLRQLQGALTQKDLQKLEKFPLVSTTIMRKPLKRRRKAIFYIIVILSPVEKILILDCDKIYLVLEN